MSPSPDRHKKPDLDLIYEGSVKRIFRDATAADALLFHFTDDYSVFDWGKMPDTIPDKGLNLTLMGAYFFEVFGDAGYFADLASRRKNDATWPFDKSIFESETFGALSKRGMPSHYLGLSDGMDTFSLSAYADRSTGSADPLYLKVREALVQRPTAHVLGSIQRTVYSYPRSKPDRGLRLIPLEVVFRLGMPQGSSLLKRVQDIQASQALTSKEREMRLAALADSLCTDPEQLQKGAGAFFARPIVEFYTKLEPQDRHLSQQEALLISGIEPDALDRLIELARILAMALYDRFGDNGNVLYDGKFEFVEDLATGEILLADSIGPDELRLIKDGRHLSKESLRLHYRDTDWYRELDRAKANPLAGFDWKKACQDATGGPEPLTTAVKQAIKEIYAGLTQDLMQKMPQTTAKKMDGTIRVLQVGGGGREHALAFRLAQSPSVETVFVAPGNGGTANEAKLQNVAINALDVDALVDFSQKERIDLVVIGPETALFTGLADRLRALGNIDVFGPGKDASKLEWSKAYAKQVMREAGLPTAGFAVAHDRKSAQDLTASNTALRVIKLDGLAQGKGVFILESTDPADRQREIAEILDQIDVFYAKNTDQAYCLVLEEMLEGEEISVFCLFDGKDYLVLPQAQDHKRRYDQDKGPNTGGMGAVSPTSKFEGADVKSRISSQVIEPLSAYLKKQGKKLDYRGVIFIGLMIAPDGTPNVLEFNARFGDPETQALMMGLPPKADLCELLRAVARGSLDRFDATPFAQDSLAPRYTVACCLVHEDYPTSSSDGQEIIFGTRIRVLEEQGNLKVFHSGTRLDRDTKRLVTSGGRILTVCATGESPQAAREILYAAIKDCHFKGMAYRKDIGLKQIAENAVNV